MTPPPKNILVFKYPSRDRVNINTIVYFFDADKNVKLLEIKFFCIAFRGRFLKKFGFNELSLFYHS